MGDEHESDSRRGNRVILRNLVKTYPCAFIKSRVEVVSIGEVVWIYDNWSRTEETRQKHGIEMMSTGAFDTRMGKMNKGKSQTHQPTERRGERNHTSVQKKRAESRGENQDGEDQDTKTPTPSVCTHIDQLCEIVTRTTNTRLMFRDIFRIYTNPENRLCTDHPQRAFILNEGIHVAERRHGER